MPRYLILKVWWNLVSSLEKQKWKDVIVPCPFTIYEYTPIIRLHQQSHYKALVSSWVLIYLTKSPNPSWSPLLLLHHILKSQISTLLVRKFQKSFVLGQLFTKKVQSKFLKIVVIQTEHQAKMLKRKSANRKSFSTQLVLHLNLCTSYVHIINSLSSVAEPTPSHSFVQSVHLGNSRQRLFS